VSSAEGVIARVAGELLKTVVELAHEASAEEQADIQKSVDEARQRIAALPALAPEIAAAAEARRRELKAPPNP
jgi:hypothetical protein